MLATPEEDRNAPGPESHSAWGPARGRATALPFALAAMLAGCGGGSVTIPEGTPVVLIVIDTLRADHLSCYGYELETTPVLDEFARSAFRFEANSTQCNSTFPSITSILTGLYPRTHRNYLPVPLEGTTVQNERYASMAERLGAAGYHTLAVVSHPSWRGELSTDGAVRRGFDEYSVIPDSIAPAERPLYARGSYTNERLFALLDRHEALPSRAPLFLWAHYFDPHTDLDNWVYDAPPEFRNRFLRHHLEAEGQARHLDTLSPLSPAERAAWIDANTTGDEHRRLRLADRRALYDAEIASCDFHLGRLFERLEELDVFDRALVIVMADHGENMEDEPVGQGRIPFTHQRLYEPVVHTPLLVKLPHQQEAFLSQAITQNIDVLPTVVELLNLEPGPAMEGSSLLALLEDTGATLHRQIFIESSDHVEKAIRTDRLKFIQPTEESTVLDGTAMVFNWREDPGETRDVSGTTDATELEAIERSMQDFRPRTILFVRATPAAEPYRLRLRLELDRTVIEHARGAAEDAVSADGRALEVDLVVDGEPLEIAIYPKSRKTAMRWSIEMEGGGALQERVFLGQRAVEETTAFPLYTEQGRAPARPAVRWVDSDDRTELAFSLEPTASLQVELRYLGANYGQPFELTASEGFGPMERIKAAHVLKARGASEAGLTVARGGGDRLIALPRIAGRWPGPDEVSLNGHGVRSDVLDFVAPFPVDARLTAVLLAGPREVPPGSVVIWMEGSSGAIEYDPATIDGPTVEQMEALGYLGNDDDDD